MPAHRRVIPSLADLPHDIAGRVPVDLLRAWELSEQDEEAHARLLAPFAKRGTLVCSDAAGLSKLTRSAPLMEVMALVHKPKTIVHAYGAAIGGTPVGIWAADNTSMFYPESVPVRDIVAQMHAAQEEIARDSRLQIGLALHPGTYHLLADGAFGEDATAIEHLAEECTRGGEILLSQHAKTFCDGTLCDFLAANDLAHELHPHRLTACRLSAKAKTPRPYPYPFTEDFAAFLDEGWTDAARQEEKWKRYGRRAHVVFLAVKHASSPFLLDFLTNWLAASLLIEKNGAGVEIVKNNGQLAIALAQSADAAVAFAKRALGKLAAAGYAASAGIAFGEVLVFPLANGSDLAGGPVNLASKLSEDAGETGVVAIEEEATEGLDRTGWTPFELSLSGVPIRGVKAAVNPN